MRRRRMEETGLLEKYGVPREFVSLMRDKIIKKLLERSVGWNKIQFAR